MAADIGPLPIPGTNVFESNRPQLSYRRLGRSVTTAPNTPVIIYTCPDSTTAIIYTLRLINDNGSGSAVRVSHVNDNSAPVTLDAVFLGNLGANSSFNLLVLSPIIMEPGHTIQLGAAQADVVGVAYGIEVSS